MLAQPHHVPLSKFIALLLRHRPEHCGLTLDEQGYVALTDLLVAMRRQPRWQWVTEEDIRTLVATSDKQRFELADGKIRARYGHSVARPITMPTTEPPAVLYHGTSPALLPAIREKGLLPMQRQYVHLSTSTQEARRVGGRHHPKPVVLPIAAHAAWQAGVSFFGAGEGLYLAGAIPPHFIQEVDFGSRVRPSTPANPVPREHDLGQREAGASPSQP